MKFLTTETEFFIGRQDEIRLCTRLRNAYNFRQIRQDNNIGEFEPFYIIFKNITFRIERQSESNEKYDHITVDNSGKELLQMELRERENKNFWRVK